MSPGCLLLIGLMRFGESLQLIRPHSTADDAHEQGWAHTATARLQHLELEERRARSAAYCRRRDTARSSVSCRTGRPHLPAILDCNIQVFTGKHKKWDFHEAPQGWSRLDPL